MTAARPGQLSALVFDLDGTLVHSLPDMAGALNSLLAEMELPTLALEDVSKMIGDGIPALVQRGLEASGRQGVALEKDAIIERFRSFYRLRLTRETRPYPGVVETLTRLRDGGWRMAVCTNKAEEPARQILSELSLDHFFEAVAGGDTFPSKKPEAEPLLGLMAGLEHPAEEAVMIGDSPADVGAARAAGFPVVAVSYGYRKVPAEALGADALIDGFGELPLALDRLFSAS